jgi:hypothetical protein
MSYFHAQKYPSEIGSHNIKKGIGPWFEHPDTFIYTYGQNIPTILRHFPYWWCGGVENNKIDIK